MLLSYGGSLTNIFSMLCIRSNGNEGKFVNIPTTYCYSEHLLERPEDWEPHVDVSGFFFLDNPDTGYAPPPELLRDERG